MEQEIMQALGVFMTVVTFVVVLGSFIRFTHWRIDDGGGKWITRSFHKGCGAMVQYNFEKEVCPKCGMKNAEWEDKTLRVGFLGRKEFKKEVDDLFEV